MSKKPAKEKKGGSPFLIPMYVWSLILKGLDCNDIGKVARTSQAINMAAHLASTWRDASQVFTIKGDDDLLGLKRLYGQQKLKTIRVVASWKSQEDHNMLAWLSFCRDQTQGISEIIYKDWKNPKDVANLCPLPENSQEMTNLTSLTLSTCEIVRNFFVAQKVGEMEHLRHLTVGAPKRCQYILQPDHVTALLKNCHTLESLTFCNIATEHVASQINKEVSKKANNLKQMTLHMKSCWWAGLVWFQLPLLEFLDVFGFQTIQWHMCKLPKLHTLCVGNLTSIQHEIPITKMANKLSTSIQHLRIIDTHVSPQMIQKIWQLFPKLETLNVPNMTRKYKKQKEDVFWTCSLEEHSQEHLETEPRCDPRFPEFPTYFSRASNCPCDHHFSKFREKEEEND
jgi:hypothetical protein